jgi:hypothetical protein
MSDDDDDRPGFAAIPIPLRGLGAALAHAMDDHDQSHMRIEDEQHRLYEFLDSLDEEGCRVLRFLLRGRDAESLWSYLREFDGMLIHKLRTEFKVDPDRRAEELLPPVPPPTE